MNKLLGMAMAAMVLAGCTTAMSRLGTYPQTLSGDAKVVVEGKTFKIWFHRKDHTLAIQRSFGASVGQSFVSGLTFNAINEMEAKPYWKAAAKAVLDQIGCQVTDVYSLDNRTSWEATYTCPADTDVIGQVLIHQSQWRAGIIAAPLDR